MDLLSEERTPSEALQYALARERGQESQQKMRITNTNTLQANPWFEKIQYIKRQNRVSILPTPQSGQIQDCRRCGNKFLPGHLNVCPRKERNLQNMQENRALPQEFHEHPDGKNLLVDNKTKIQHPDKSPGEFRCFDNNKINILGTIHVDITSGTSTAKNCTILLVDTNTINIMGRDFMDKLGLRLTMGTQQKEGERNLLNITNTHLRISKWIFQKYPHLCSRLGRSRNHVAKSTFKSEINPTQHKGRRIPLHLVEKVENELKKSLHKCEFGLTEITWLGYEINSEGITPTKRKTEAIIYDHLWAA